MDRASLLSTKSSSFSPSFEHCLNCIVQNNLGLIKVVLHSGHGVILLGVFELLQVHLTLTIEPTNLTTTGPLGRADLTSKILTASREHCMSYSWWILMVADRNCSKTVPPNKNMAHIFCLLDRLTGSYCCSLHKNLASECDEVLGSAALEEAYAGQVEPALQEGSF